MNTTPELSTGPNVSEVLAAVDKQLERTRYRFSLSALACIRGAPDGDKQVSRAIASLDEARKALQGLQYDLTHSSTAASG